MKPEDLELIIKFMGIQKTDIGWYDSKDKLSDLHKKNNGNTFDNLFFSTDWNYLMCLVEEIHEKWKLMEWDTPESNHIEETIFPMEITMSDFMQNDIEAIYRRCISFIKYYNTIDHESMHLIQ